MKQKLLSPIAKSIVHAMQAGKLIAHPTSTLPGLSFNPNLPKAFERLLAIKNREAHKGVIGLVNSLNIALQYWQPLPDPWPELLAKVWPDQLTVVYAANEQRTPSCLLDVTGSLALRMDPIIHRISWMQEVLDFFNGVFPSTSVNISGNSSACTWDEVINFALDKGDIFVPPDPVLRTENFFNTQPSTLIKIFGDGSFRELRRGSFNLDQLLNIDEDLKHKKVLQ